MEAIWVAAEMRAGGAYAHSILAIEEMEKAAAPKRVSTPMDPVKRASLSSLQHVTVPNPKHNRRRAVGPGPSAETPQPT